MITAFTVKNFKAIGEEPVRIELKPITLLFGANSAGKSSILHALYYAYEVFNNRNLNAGKITLGENNSLDLGGFRRFIYGTDKDEILTSITMKFDLDLVFNSYIEDFSNSPNKKTDPYELLSKVATAYVEVEISWSHISCIPYVSRYETGINGERIAIISAIDDGKNGDQVAISHFNIAHHIFSDFWVKSGKTLDRLIENCIKNSFIRISENQERNQERNERNKLNTDQYKTRKKRQQVIDQVGHVPKSEFIFSSDVKNFGIRLYYQEDALPYSWKHGLSFHDVWLEVKPLSKNIRKLLNLIIIEPGKHVAKFLQQMCYLGPLREIPSRFLDTDDSNIELRLIQSKRWVTGLGAWDTLYSIGQKQLYEVYKSVPSPDQNWTIERDGDYPDEFDLPIKYLERENGMITLDNINYWLTSTELLNTGYEVVIEHYREIPSELIKKILTANQLLADNASLANEILLQTEKIRIWLHDKSRNIKLTPHEIGVGISQVLPVVVAAIGVEAPLVIIEQPELHIHPAVQVKLGDLFITQSSKHKLFMIETHSEHLLLRLLRRINETFEGKLPTDVEPCTAYDVAIYYLEKGSQGLRVRRLEISEDGDSKGDWPEGFFEERRAELF